LRNLGNIDIHSFAINAKLDERSLINERFDTDTLQPGQGKLIPFKTRFQASSGKTPGYLCLEIIDVNGVPDDNADNNRKCITASDKFELFDIYPNPVSNNLNLGINLQTEGTVTLKAITLLGQSVMAEQSYDLQKGYSTLSLDTKGLQGGLYLLEINYNDNKIYRRFLKYRD
jgi:hypothetical protein